MTHPALTPLPRLFSVLLALEVLGGSNPDSWVYKAESNLDLQWFGK